MAQRGQSAPIKIVAASDLRQRAQQPTSGRFLNTQSLRTDPQTSTNLNVSF